MGIGLTGNIVTLEIFYKDQFDRSGAPTIALRTLQQYCQDGAIPGAFKYPGKRKWWIDLKEMEEGCRKLHQPPLPQTEKHLTPATIAKESAKTKKNSVGDGMDDFDYTIPTWAQK